MECHAIQFQFLTCDPRQGDELDAYDDMDAEVDIVGDQKTEDELESEAQAKAAAKLLEMAEAVCRIDPEKGLCFVDGESDSRQPISQSEHGKGTCTDSLVDLWLRSNDWPQCIGPGLQPRESRPACNLLQRARFYGSE